MVGGTDGLQYVKSTVVILSLPPILSNTEVIVLLVHASNTVNYHRKRTPWGNSPSLVTDQSHDLR